MPREQREARGGCTQCVRCQWSPGAEGGRHCSGGAGVLTKTTAVGLGQGSSRRFPSTFPARSGKHAQKQNWNHCLCHRCASSASRACQPSPHPTLGLSAHTSSLTRPHSETPQLSQSENDHTHFWHRNPPHRLPWGVTRAEHSFQGQLLAS